MKKLMMIILTVVALSSCEQTASEMLPEPSMKEVTSKGRQVTVNTEVQTKTAITPKQNGYSLSWKQSDAIRLFEIVYENYGSSENNAEDVDWFNSAELQDDASSASFTVDLNTTLTAPDGAKYRYVATYPSDYPYFDSYWSVSDDYNAVWPDSECSFNHLVLYTEFPYQQFPLSTSFDPHADLMVSSQKVLDARADGNIQLNFARIGAIVKMSLTGLAAGEKVETGYVLFGDSFKVNTEVEYDVELGEVRYAAAEYGALVGKETWETDYRFGFSSNSAVEINPVDLYVDDNGNADIWLRLPAGKVTDSFSVRVWTRPYQNTVPGEWHSFGKSVDLASLGRSLTFENGRLTNFSVATEVMEDPYLRLSCSYPDAYGSEHNEVTEDGHISVGKYGAYLSPTGGTVVLDVETNADPSDVIINNYCSWADASFNPETMKLTLTYNPCSEYTNYMVSSREGYIYVELSSFAVARVQIDVNQLKPYFADSGTRKSILTWHGGTVTGLIKCNSEPVIICPDDTDKAVSWVTEKVDKGYNITFTVDPNQTNTLSALTAYIKDSVSPDSKYVSVNLLRYPMISDGDYYILTENTHNGTPYHWYGIGADIDNGSNAFACDISFDGDGKLDFDNTNYLKAFTFTRIEDSEDYRITCKKGEITYYLSFGSQRQTNQYFLTLNVGAPLIVDGKDTSRWDVVSLGSEIAIRNHVYAENTETAPFLIHFKLDGPSVYLRRASSIEITDNQGSYGTSYFCKATTWAESWNSQTELPCNVRLYDISTGTYFPQPY